MATLTSTSKVANTPETYWPDATGWDVSALPAAKALSVDATLATADLNDSALTLRCIAQWSAVVSPTEPDWRDLVGGTWKGGVTGRGGAKHPHYGPYVGSIMPLNAKRVRVRVIPARTTATFSWTLTIT